jgi:hypothetical protein
MTTEQKQQETPAIAVGEQIYIWGKNAGTYAVYRTDDIYIYVSRMSAAQKKIQYVTRRSEDVTWNRIDESGYSNLCNAD